MISLLFPNLTDLIYLYMLCDRFCITAIIPSPLNIILMLSPHHPQCLQSQTHSPADVSSTHTQ